MTHCAERKQRMKTEWNAAQYLRFEDQRNQPVTDLLGRIRQFSPRTAVDLGCGPGNSTIRVRQTFPDAQVVGIDSSGDMIRRAKAEHPDLRFLQQDLHELEGTYDLIFSNACLQWVPDHEHLIPQLVGQLNEGGIFAAQFPMNSQEPLYQIIAEVVAEPKWGFDKVKLDYNGMLTPHAYFDLLSSCCGSFQIWETKYYHDLADHQAMIEWVKGTKIRPYLAYLQPGQREDFENELLERAKEVYPVMKNGKVIFCFNRFFMVGMK